MRVRARVRARARVRVRVRVRLVLPPHLVPLELALLVAHLLLTRGEGRLPRRQAHLAPRHLLRVWLRVSRVGARGRVRVGAKPTPPRC